jgi:hypothetical protein
MAIQCGTHLGPYEILSAIGAGGLAEVYRGHDPTLGRNVAIKIRHRGRDFGLIIQANWQVDAATISPALRLSAI